GADLDPTAPARPGDHNPANPARPADADTKPSSTPADADKAAAAATPAPDRHPAASAAAQPQSPTPPDPASASGLNLPAQPPSVATPVSAAQLTATAATPLAVPVSGLAVQIAASARSGNTRFEIRLDPAELGRIDVRLDVDRHGRVTSHLTVEKPETLAMLRQDAPQLQRALEDAGLKTGDNGLQFSLRDQSSGQHSDSGAERQSHRLVVSETAAAPLVAAAAIHPYAASASRGIDIRV
ncbi:MAG: flagellar hook-length control protein FliK, partial [Xanthobacteraceae bacterium]